MSLRYLSAGESHGQALMGIIDGLPAGIPVSESELAAQMQRRKIGHGRGRRQQIETDAVQILAGVRHGETLGSPVGLLLPNRDWKNWQEIMSPTPIETEAKRQVHIPRPGHADLVGAVKYGYRDLRNALERASARETAMRVALGCFARQFLAALDMHVASRVLRIGAQQDLSPLDLPVAALNERVDASPVRALDKDAEARMMAEIDRAQAEGDSLGGVFEVYAEGLPIGLGAYSQWDRRLDARLGEVLLGLNAIKGVELGLGFRAAEVPGSQAHDEMLPGGQPLDVRYASNHSGGINAGVSTGQPLVLRVAKKPIATLMRPLDSVDIRSGEAAKAHIERSDTCAVPAAAVIAESLVCLVLADFVLEKFGGDSLAEIQERLDLWRQRTQAGSDR
jgi:chorismate synthase